MRGEQQFSERMVANYAAAARAWADSMVVDTDLEAVFHARIGSAPGEYAEMSSFDRILLNARYKRWQAQCGITEEQTPEERMTLALAHDGPVVD